MAENYRFFDSAIGDTRSYNSEDFSEYFETLINTGLIVGFLNELNPTVTGANMIVTVDTGNAFINGRWYENDSSLDKTFDTEGLGNDRIDLLVLRLDLNTSERKITFEIVKGTPSVTPVAPTLTRNSTIYELGLAEVFITGGQSFIAPGDLTDLRQITTSDPFSFPSASSNVLISANQANRIVGTYTGNGNATRDISIGVTPVLVFITTLFQNASLNVSQGDILLHSSDGGSMHNLTQVSSSVFNSGQGFSGQQSEIITDGFRVKKSGADGLNVSAVEYGFVVIY